jgi:hypothetical protein
VAVAVACGVLVGVDIGSGEFSDHPARAPPSSRACPRYVPRPAVSRKRLLGHQHAGARAFRSSRLRPLDPSFSHETNNPFGGGVEPVPMADDDATDDAEDVQESTDDGADADGSSEGEEKSFRERVEEIRERREQEREEGERPGPEEMMGGEGGPGGMGGGNPFAQMMSGMMGGGGPGGPGGMGGGPPGMGGRERGGEESVGSEELVREVRQLRDEVRDITRQLQRIGDALEDD